MLPAIAFLLCAATSMACAQSLVVYNVQGYTPTATGATRFTGLVIEDGKVRRVLQQNEQPPTSAEQVDGRGAFVLPGLIDAHGHVLDLGRQALEVDLRGSASLQDVLDRVQRFARTHADAPWIIGRGWNQVLWTERRFPTARELDRAVSDRPVVLTRIDGHAVWVNSSALRRARIDRATRDPKGGQIVRDANDAPTGVLVDAAAALVERHIPAPTDAAIKHALQVAMAELASLGLTSVHDAGIDARQYRIYEELGRANALPIRIYAMLADSKDAHEVIRRGPAPGQFDDRLQLRAVKAWVDGALGSRGAALLEDYDDQAGHRGLLLYDRAQLTSLATLTARHGWQLNLHAIGDAANRIALDVFASALSEQQRIQLRPRIEHAQVIALQDIARFKHLHVIASIQPTHATSDMNMAETRVGAQRIRGAYAWRRILDAGVQLAGGSDFPVELPNPFLGLHAAVTRQNRAGQPSGGWYSDQKLNREEALRLFTLDAARAGHMEQVLGSLEVSKWADFIMLDRDYFAVPEQGIADIKVLQTWVGGRRIPAP